MTNLLPNILRVRIPRWGRRVPIRADHLNQMVDAQNKLIEGVQPPRFVLRTIGGARKQQFIILEGGVRDQYLHCHTWAGALASEGTELILVARPWDLRSHPEPFSRDGKTYTRIGVQERHAVLNGDTSKTETQVLNKRYYDRNVIKASTGIVGGLGSDTLAALGVQWEDNNADGRAWAEKNVSS